MPDETEALFVRVAEFLDSHVFGKYRGIVREVGDGDDLGFVRAEVPEIFGSELSPWATPSVPFAGNQHGWVTIPEEDDGVWIEFEGGNLSKPIWTGFWWAQGEIPTPSGPKTRLLATTEGHKFVLDDEGSEIKIEHADGPSITLTGNGITLSVGAKKIEISDSSVSINGSNLEIT